MLYTEILTSCISNHANLSLYVYSYSDINS